VSFARPFLAVALALLALAAPASAARQIVDLHKLDAYFALFAADSNVPWQPTRVRLDTYSSAPVAFSVYQVDPADVVTAGSNGSNRAIDTRGLRPIAAFAYTPPGGYQFQSNQVDVSLGSREGFFVVEARRGDVGEQVWINRTRVGLITKETPGELVLYGADLGSGRALARMRVQFLVGSTFVTRETDAHGIVRWNKGPRPIFALAQWGSSYAFTTLLPQAPLPATIVGVRTESAVVHAGDAVRIVGFARTRDASLMKPASGSVAVSMRLGATLLAQANVPLDAAGAFTTTLNVPANAAAGDYAILAQQGSGVGGATVHVDADANGLSLNVASGCDGTCDFNADIPVTIVSSQGNTLVHVRVVRSPHVYVGYTPDEVPWGTVQWLDTTVRTDGGGHATVTIAHPTDGLSSTYGVRADAGGATAVTRIVVPTAHASLRLRLDRDEQTLGTPLNFDVYANDVASGRPLAGQQVSAQLTHGPSTQAQTLTLDANGHAHGTFSSPALGTNLVLASLTVDGAQASDAAQVDIVAQATQDTSANGSSDVHITLDRATYHAGDDIRVDATLDGAKGDVLVTLESAIGVQTVVAPTNGGHARVTLKAADLPGDLRVGAAFIRNGAVAWSTVPLVMDAPGRPQTSALDVGSNALSAGQSTTVSLRDTQASPGTVAVRISRGAPSGSALFDSAPLLMAVGTAATQVTAPEGNTWHPWVDSTGEHAQILGFERRSAPPADLTISEADTQAVQWSVARDNGQPIAVQLPAARGRYTISVLKISDDGRVVAASSTVVVQ
jgi:hypothetical protein